MPGEDQERVLGKNVAEDIGVRKDGAEHQRPRDDAPAAHRMRDKQILAAEDSFSDQRAGDAVGDGVHSESLMNKEKRVFLRHYFSDAAGGNAVMLHGGESRFSGFGRDGDEQAPGGLRIEEQILKFGRDAGVENRAIANESAVILQTAGEMAFAGGFDGAGKIGEG